MCATRTASRPRRSSGSRSSSPAASAKPQRRMIELAPHQTEAVERIGALLDRFRGAILADEVGLGKSFVAAAVAASSCGEIEVIVPAALVAQWRETLHDFGVD